MSKKGLFIVLEGIDGAGKSSVINTAKELLYKKYPNIDFYFTREPGGSNSYAELIRDFFLKHLDDFHPITIAYLYAASRAEHTITKLLPKINNGSIVICDRYVHSSYAYQGKMQNVPMEIVHQINKVATTDIAIDYLIYFKVDAKTAMNRIMVRDLNSNNVNAFDKKEQTWYETLIDQYEEAISTYQKPKKIIVIDANRSWSEVFNEFFRVLTTIIDNYQYDK
ncbi:dTMP kinase [Ureaplasma canigenitalium]|uniref:dTMP kinase n=1 Tax=Ureaplasma canigenitalium TaxID=42092 RepID=UPI000AE55D5C|nr:dTMP kinase [Ureaplasma canigenitalium]